MNQDLIDLIYHNEEVEGVAISSSNGAVIENQLALTDSSLEAIAVTVAKIKLGLSDAKRHLKGFLFRSNSSILQVCIFDEYVVFVQLVEPYSAVKIERSIRSIFGEHSGETETQTQQINATQERVEQYEKVIAEPPADHIKLDDFITKLKTLLKRVAPGGVADNMINQGCAAANVDLSSTETIAKSDAIDLGQTVIGKIPNASRRKIILKEYETVITSL